MRGGEPRPRWVVARKAATMVLFGFWLLAGLAIGMTLMAFLAMGTYQRGYEEGYFLRRPWRAELEARRLAFGKVDERETRPAASSRMVASSSVEASPRAAATG
jgi:hypothetical protein